ncbi:metallophosphoesterase family protein [Coprothermobacter platensis]|uniref:metallophosphoesterase family protein n=1 Tax=Coprothermobacter platensis TaxID=108819 RepID=UPI0003650FB4|nr:metallophosphoesterase [Coprothermobacter platensis]
MLIAASSDIHSPKYIGFFIDSVRKMPEPDLFLLAGDLILRGAVGAFDLVHDEIRKNWPEVPLIGVFGNEEFENAKRKLRREYNDVMWLDDEAVQVKGIDIYGTTGVLDEPTPWQSKSIPGIEKIYEKRIENIDGFVQTHPHSIVLSHYAVGTYTIDPVSYPLQLTSDKLFQRLRTSTVTIIHGHCHYAPQWIFHQDNMFIYNVALPLHKAVVLLNL